MKIRNKKLRDLASIIFTVYYLIAAEQADEKVRKIRAVMTVDHLRVAWNKPNTPYLSFFTRIMRPRFTNYKPRKIRIPRPKSSMYKEPVNAWMYFNGTLPELRTQTNLVLDIPGGGFVAMDPRTSDDKLLAWAGRTGLPILSLDYRKAPEYPYPYALNECYDVYHMIVATRGRCIGIEGEMCPRIVLTGDSAGGNLTTGTALMIIQSNMAGGRGMTLPSPAGLVLMYPALDMNIGSWMTDDQMALIKNPRTARKHENFIKRKSEDIDNRYTPTTPRPSDDESEDNPKHDFFSDRNSDKNNDKDKDSHEKKPSAKTQPNPQNDVEAQRQAVATSKPQRLKTRLAVSSMISYFGDRILTPEMMRAMIILYVGPYSRPDFTTDHLLCPAVAPEPLLTRFPKTYILTGERDPLVDDTVLFAGRLRQAKLHLFQERKDLGLEKSNAEFDEKKYVEVALIPGVSHGFVQFVSIYPEGWKHIFRCGKWIQDIFAEPPTAFEAPSLHSSLKGRLGHAIGMVGNSDSGLAINGSLAGRGGRAGGVEGRHHRRIGTAESSGDDDRPLEMSRMHSTNTPPLPSSSPPPPSTQRRNDTPISGSTATTNGTSNAHSPSNFEKSNLRLNINPAANTNTNNTGHSHGTSPGDMLSSPEEDRKESGRRRHHTRSKSAISLSLGSEEDLLKRRMNGLTVSLMGDG
jgi:acetyl esterase/lipase